MALVIVLHFAISDIDRYVCGAVYWSTTAQDDSDELIVVLIALYFSTSDLDRSVNISFMETLKTVYVSCIGYSDGAIELFDANFADFTICDALPSSTTIQNDCNDLIEFAFVFNLAIRYLDRSGESCLTFILFSQPVLSFSEH
ncbi:unnamed protein product [Rotaria socialis]